MDNNEKLNQQSNQQQKNNFSQEQKRKKTIIIVIIIIIAVIFVPFIISTVIATFAVSGQLDEARKGTFADEAQMAISATKNDFIMSNYNTNQCYNLDKINTSLEKKLDTSPFGSTYSNTSYVKIEVTQPNTYNYYICLADNDGNGISYTSEDNISADNITTNVTCTLPPECN